MKTKNVLIAAAVAALSTGAAMAEVPAEVTAAIASAKTDLLSLLAGLTAAGVAIWVGSVLYNRFRVK